jgi:hypothetical protein
MYSKMNMNSNHLCHGRVTDDQFLEHMIPHHQMAIDMSRQVSKYSTNPAILSMARDIIWSQQNEIWVMKALLRSPSFCSDALKGSKDCPILSYPRSYVENNLELSCYYPAKSEDLKTKGKCDMKFMKPCGEQEPIINNYNKKKYTPNFWRGLATNYL